MLLAELARRLDDLSERVARLERLTVRQERVSGRNAQPADEAPLEPTPPAVVPPLSPSDTDDRYPGLEEPRQDGSAAWDAERRIAGQVYAAIGAVVVVVGVAMFFELARRNQWLDRVPDLLKCLGGAAFGAALLVAGEVLRPKSRGWGTGRGARGSAAALLRFVPAAICAAGLGALYASAFAAYAAYELVGPVAGFALLAATAGLGIALGTRSREAATTVLSLIGGYVAPMLVDSPEAHAVVLPAYLVALLMVGLGVCGLSGGAFVAVRAVAWWATLVLGGLWVAANGDQHPIVGLGFLSAVWGVVHAELAWTARRDGLSGPLWPEHGFMPRWGPSRAYSVSLSTTAWTCLLGTSVLVENGSRHDWLVCGVGCVVTYLWSMTLAGRLRVLRDRPETDAERLGATLVLESGALLIGAIALALSGWLEVAAWLGMGVAAVAAGTWLRVRSLHVYGLIVLAIAATRLLVYDSLAGLTVPAESVAGLLLSRWSLLMTVAAIAVVAAAYLLLRPSAVGVWGRVACCVAGAGVSLLFGALVSEHVNARSLTVTWILLSVAVSAVHRVDRRLRLDVVAFLGSLAAASAWLAADPPYPADHGSGGSSWVPSMPFLVGMALVATTAGHAWRFAGPKDAALRRAALVVSVLVALVASTSEVARLAAGLSADRTAREAAVSMWWGLSGLGLVLAGFVRRTPSVRRAGLALLGVAVAKALLLDLASVALEGRVASFLGLGLLMLAVSVLYNRLAARAAPQAVLDRPRGVSHD